MRIPDEGYRSGTLIDPVMVISDNEKKV